MVNTTKPPPTAPRSRLDGDGLLGMFLSALHLLERNVDKINALNVFPVPDGDTGVNMTLTLKAAVGADLPTSATVAEVSQAISRGAILGARGNSGVVTSDHRQRMTPSQNSSSDRVAPTARFGTA